MRKISNKKKKLFYYVILLIVGIFYYFFLGEQGYILGADSTTFMDNEVSEYWVYIGFLDVCEYLFGTSLYLEAVNVLQGIIALLVSIVVTLYFQDRFQLRNWEAVLVYIATFLPYGYSLPQSVATHHILTEGLSYSFFHLFLLFLVMVILDNRVYMLVPTALMLVLLIGTRSQLMLLVAVYFAIVVFLIWNHIYKKLNNKGKVLLAGLSASVVIMVIASVPVMMKFFMKNETMSQFIHAMSGRALCTIESHDIEDMDEKYKGVAQYIFEQVDENEYREIYFRDGLRRWEDILDSTNENTIQMSKWMLEYCDKMELNAEQRSEISRTRYYLTKYLFDKHLDSYLEMTMWLCIQSFVASVFIHPDVIYTLCHIIALGIYLFAVVLLLINKRMNRQAEARIPLILSSFVLGANVVITNLIFFGQQRYVVYTFGFFYISLYILLRDTLLRGKNVYDKNKIC